ncbi:unnamed protein product [Auanema sp. JU1783]|nr:unnamed protein product [Auanema sp. JU1783]
MSVTEDVSRAAARHRSRSSLKKSAAVSDDDPSLEHKRASSFDVSQIQTSSIKFNTANFRPGSAFDGATNRISAFSPVDVPRLLIHSPASPLNQSTERNNTPDNNLLTVPSPDFPRKSPVDRAFGCELSSSSLDSYFAESPKSGHDYLSLGLNSALINHLAMAASIGINMDTPEQNKNLINFNQNQTNKMECSNSLDSLPTTSIDLPAPPATQDMPPKAIIQDDIRSGQGRFRLVRKRGRSEVWNLFGQVLDTVNNVRLPFVACYACKVLYTDTGGGTGNMTRHRCPIGVSYRSSAHGSSTETNEPLQQSSFESNISVSNRQMDHKPTLSLTINSEDSSGGTQLVSQNSGEVSIGDMDREALTDAIVRCCAQDLLDPAIFNGRGFKALFERIWYMAKRPGILPSEVYPDSEMISSSLQSTLRFCTDDLKNELSRTSQGVCLALESLSYAGRVFKVVHGSRISHDWKWRSNVLGVFKARENQSLGEIINLVIHNYELDRSLLRVTCSRNCEEFAPLRTFLDIKEKLREILLAILTTSSVPILPMVTTLDTILKKLLEAEIRLPFEHKPCEDDIFNLHRMLTDWNDHLSTLEEIIRSKAPSLLPAFSQIDGQHLRDIEIFLDPFKETIESLTDEKPNFHKVLPEWYALMHESQATEEDFTPFLKELKQKAFELLGREKDNVITVEHRIAAILNPRLNRRQNSLCTEMERQHTCDRIRALCGIRSPKEPLSRGSSTDGEPFRKRRMFLNALEDDPVSEDELECYLRSQFPTHQTKDLVFFWSNAGRNQFPSLSSLARRILSVPATAPRTEYDPRLASVSPDQLHTFLMLKSLFETDREDRPQLY